MRNAAMKDIRLDHEGACSHFIDHSRLGLHRSKLQLLNAGSLELGKESLQYRLNVAQEVARDRSQQSRCGWGRTAVRSHSKRALSLANLLYTFYTFYTDFKKGVFCNRERRFLQQSQVYAGRVSQFQAFLATAFTQRGTNPTRPVSFEQKG